jgi:flagellar hook-associated protein 1 FlgK
MSLLGSLSSVARALEAQRFGLDVAGQNIANVNTPGYARREALLASVPGTTPQSPGGGVEVAGVRAARDAMLDRRLLQERPAEERERAIADAMSIIETAIGRPGASLDAALSGFFDSASRLAADPLSSRARQEILEEGRSVALAFQAMAGRLNAARTDADAQVRAVTGAINQAGARLAAINAALSGASGSISLQLRDEQAQILEGLAGLLDISTIPRPDGGVDVSFGNGQPLVIAATAYPLQAVSQPPSGLAGLVSEGAVVTSEITAGKLGGLLHVRDAAIPDYIDALDTLAAAFASSANAVHMGGVDLQGAAGLPLFVPPAAGPGAASALAINPAVAADVRRVAASDPSGDGNGAVRRLADLRDARVMDGGTTSLLDGWARIVYRVGSDTAAAQQEQASRQEIVRQVQVLRDQVSGVSLDEEALTMMKFQRAYEANARFFRAVEQTIDTLMQAVAR